jgi:hypothetical protein
MGIGIYEKILASLSLIAPRPTRPIAGLGYRVASSGFGKAFRG